MESAPYPRRMVSDLKDARGKEPIMYPHPELMQELARQHQLELIEDAVQYRRIPRGRHRRHALRFGLRPRSGGPEDH
jgi:hypothetical protein